MGHYVAGLFSPGGAARKKAVKKAPLYTHVRGGGCSVTHPFFNTPPRLCRGGVLKNGCVTEPPQYMCVPEEGLYCKPK